METINTNPNTEQQPTTPTPEAAGGRTFTQDEVNKIVSDRLAREREKQTQQTALDEREKALREREQAFEAKEARAAKEAAVRAYYTDNGIVGAALDIAMKGSEREIDALELDGGKVKNYGAIDALIGGLFAGLVSTTTTIGANTPTPPANTGGGSDRLAEAFKPKI